MRGIPSDTTNSSCSSQPDSDEDSVVSASSEKNEGGIQEAEEGVNNFENVFHNLFQSKDSQMIGKAGDFSFYPINKEDIPHNLISIIEDCEITQLILYE